MTDISDLPKIDTIPQLVVFLGEKFTKIDNKLKKLDRLAIDIAIIKSDYVTKEDIKNLATKASVEELKTSVDNLALRVKENTDEITVLGERQERMESWVKLAAPKVGIDYKP
jgi:hypothetical protein